MEQNGQEVIKDEYWIFRQCLFECNLRYYCMNCKYREECKSFQRCFEGTIPTEVWRSVSCFEQLIHYVNEWREYQNEQTTKQ